MLTFVLLAAGGAAWAQDGTPPAGGTIGDGTGVDVDVQVQTDKLSAFGAGFDDPDSGVMTAEWAIGTTPGGEDVRAFTMAGLQRRLAPVWLSTWDGAAGLNDRMLDVAIDSGGTILAVGRERGPAGGSVLQRWNRAGALQGTLLIAPWVTNNGGASIGLDEFDRVHVAVTSGDGDILVRRYSAGLVPLWTEIHDSGGEDIAGQHMDCRPSGELYVSGATFGLLWDPWVRRYPAGGPPPTWTAMDLGNPDNDYTYAIAALRDGGSVSVGMDKHVVGNIDIGVWRHSAAGALVWSELVDSGFTDVATAVAVDPTGIYVGGMIGSVPLGGVWDIWLRKYSLDGFVLWTRTYDGPASGWDLLFDIDIDRDGSLWLSGGVDSAVGVRDLWLAHTASDGSLLWSDVWGGAAGGYDCASAGAIDGTGVVVGGYVEKADGTTDFLLRRYATADWTAGATGLSLVPGRTYYSSLRVTNRSGLQTVVASDGVQILDAAPPTVGAVTATPAGPLEATFTADVSDAGGIAWVSWDFDGDGDADYGSAIGGAVVFTYGAPGTYAARLTVVDASGNVSTRVVVVTVSAPATGAALSLSATGGTAPLTVDLSVTGAPAGVLAYEWDFDGDGAFDRVTAGPAIAHAYLAAGAPRPRARAILGDGSALLVTAGPIAVALPAAAAGLPVRIVRLYRDLDRDGSSDLGPPDQTVAVAAGGLGAQVGRCGDALGFTAETVDPAAVWPGLEIARWEWDFDGDGTFDAESAVGADGAWGTHAVHAFSPPGDVRPTARCVWRVAGGGVEQFAVAAGFPLTLEMPTLVAPRVWIDRPEGPRASATAAPALTALAGNAVLFEAHAVPAPGFQAGSAALQMWNAGAGAWTDLPSAYATVAIDTGGSRRWAVDVAALVADGFLGIASGDACAFRVRALLYNGTAVVSAADGGPGTPEGTRQGPACFRLVGGAGVPANGLRQTHASPERCEAEAHPASGREAALTRGARAEVGSGATDATGTLALAELPAAPAAVPGSLALAGFHEATLTGSSLLGPVAVRLPFADADGNGVEDATGVPVTGLAVHRWTGTAWQPLPDRGVSVGERWVEGCAAGPGWFAVGGASLPPTTAARHRTGHGWPSCFVAAAGAEAWTAWALLLAGGACAGALARRRVRRA